MSDSYENASGATVTAEQQEVRWDSLGIEVYIKSAVIGVLLWFFYREDVGRIVFRWVDDSSWSHGFLIPLFSLYFLNQNKEQIISLKPRRCWLGLFLMICCIVFYPLNAVYFKFMYLQPLAMIASIGAVVLFLGGWGLLRIAWLPVMYLIFAVPLPAGIYKAITIPMRILASQIATVMLNFVPNLQAEASGVTIDVIYKGVTMEPALNVAEACSGMRLLMAFMALGVAMAYLHYRPLWQRLVLLCSTIPIAIFCNVVRVTVTGFIYILWDSKYAQGIYHDMLGMLMLPLAFGLYGFLAWFMSNLLVEEKDRADEDVIIRRQD